MSTLHATFEIHSGGELVGETRGLAGVDSFVDAGGSVDEDHVPRGADCGEGDGRRLRKLTCDGPLRTSRQ